MFGEAKFTVHKWSSNDLQLESGNIVPVDEQQSYAKQQLGVKEGEIKILGLPWYKREDLIAVAFPKETCRRDEERNSTVLSCSV